MAEGTQLPEDNTAITFDLNSFFDENQDNIEIVSENDVPDSILGELMDSVNQTFPELAQNQGASASSTATAEPQKQVLNRRFPVLSTEEIDDIANNTCKKKTRKQTVWGIKVFRGNYNLLFAFRL